MTKRAAKKNQKEQRRPQRKRVGASLSRARKIRQYDELDREKFERLRREPLAVVRSVLSKHRVEGSLPPILSCEFPKPEEFVWNPILSEKQLSFEDDLRFSVARILSNKTKVEEFVDLRSQFTMALLRGNLAGARAALKHCAAEFGLSSWLLEARLLLADTEGGFEQIRDELTQILELQIPQNAMVIAEFASQRVDMTMSVIEYMRRIQEMASREEYAEYDAALPSYLCFVGVVPQVGFRQFSLEEASFILRCESTRPVIDHYQSTKRLLRNLVFGNQKFLASDSKTGPIGELIQIHDEDLSFARLITDNIDSWLLGPELISRQRQISGGSSDSVEACAKLLNHEPLNFGAYETLAVSCIVGDATLPSVFPIDSLGHSLLAAAETFLRHNDESSNAFWLLVKYSNALGCTPLGPQIDAICVQGFPSSIAETRKKRLLCSKNASAGIFPSLTFLDERDRESQINTIRCSVFVSSNIDSERHYANSEKSPLEKLCHGCDFAAEGLFEQALTCFEEVLASPGIDAFCESEALRGAVESCIELSRFGTAAKLIAESAVPLFPLVHIVPIGKLVNGYNRECNEIDLGCIAWPNLHFLDYAFGNTTSRELYSSYANFLSAHGITRPHELPEFPTCTSNATQLKMFLHVVCNTECMESDCSFLGTNDVEQERVAILHKLQLMYPEDIGEYAQEISQLQQQISVREAISYGAESKIYFNLEGVEKSLPKSFTERFNRYLLYKTLSTEKRRVPSSEWSSSDSPTLETHDGALSHFVDLFQEIWRTVLFSNEHGLDSYLSVRIRHQTIHGAIRSVFDRAKLIAEKDEGVYQTDGYWRSALPSLSTETCDEIELCIASFARRIDRVIEAASSRWVKIRHGTMNRNGWFDLEFNPSELRLLSQRFLDISYVDDFIDEVVLRIRERLTDSLVTVRNNVQHVLGSHLRNAVSRLSDELREKCDPVPAEIVAAITHAETALQNRLDEIAGWFQIQDELRLEDFGFDTLIKASIENVRKCYPSSSFRCSVKGSSNLMVAGEHFPSLWDLMFLIFGNIVRHAASTCHETDLHVTETDELLIVQVSNNLADESAAEEARTRLDSALKHQPTMIPKEEGSGFAKIRNILQSDLGQDDHCFAVDVTDTRFSAIVYIDIRRICA